MSALRSLAGFFPGVLFLFGLLLLGGCLDDAERARRFADARRTEIQTIQTNLPPGCRVSVPGQYAGRDVILVACQGRSASINLDTQSGKFSHRDVQIWFEDDPVPALKPQ